MKIVNVSQMRELEQRADASGNSYAAMMERAGTLVAEAIRNEWDVNGKHVLVLIGPGNNGGDGLVCARVLHDAGSAVMLYLWKRAASEDDANWKLCQERGIPFLRAKDDSDFSKLEAELAQSDFVIDALLGTGVARPLEGKVKDLLDHVKNHIAKPSDPAALTAPAEPALESRAHPAMVAIDLPTGLNPDTGELDPATFQAERTITFGFPKIGHYAFPGANAVGRLTVADIGIPKEWADSIPLAVATAEELAALVPRRPLDSNKGTFGKAMLACGSLQFTGAPTLAGHAAGRVGAGLVTLALPQTIHPIVAAKIDEATFLPLIDRLGDWRPRAANDLLATLWDSPYEALLVGCGLGRADTTREFLLRLLDNMPTLEKPPALVLDADALNLLAEIPEWSVRFSKQTDVQFSPPPIITPHPGEMARLLGIKTREVQANRIEIARDAAKDWNVIVVLKGAFTVIASPQGRITLLPFANPALATAGTGDVLAGAITGLLAQYRAAASKHASEQAAQDDAYNAALLGGYVHGLAAERHGIGMVAGDLLHSLPNSLARVGGTMYD